MKNSGIVIYGGSLNANSVVAGSHAHIDNHANEAASNITQKIDALMEMLEASRARIDNIEELLSACRMAQAEAQNNHSNKSNINDAMSFILQSVSAVSELDKAVKCITDIIKAL